MNKNKNEVRLIFDKFAKNLKKNLLWYSLITIGIGWALGLAFPSFAKTHKTSLINLTTVLVFLMIYPMMVNPNLERIPKVLKEPKPVLLSLAYNFVLTPIVAFLLVRGFIHDPNLALGFLLIMLVPGSSMSIAYTNLPGGDLITWPDKAFGPRDKPSGMASIYPLIHTPDQQTLKAVRVT